MGLLFFACNMPAPTGTEREELATSYAALILHDDKLPITVENINTLLAAANVRVAAFWPRIFAKALSGRDASDIDDIILGGGAVAAPVAAAGGAAAAAGGAEKPAEEEEEEEDEDMGFGLFD